MFRSVPTALAVLFTLAALSAATGCRKPADPANVKEMREDLGKKVGWVMGRVDPTDEQEKKIDALLDGLAPDLFAFQQQNQALKRRLMTILAADKVDKAALNALRKDSLALFDRYTKRLTTAGVDVTTILSPAQRKELVGMWRKWEFGDE